MQPYPHVYQVAATGGPTGPIPVSAAGLPELATAAPPEFDGPGGAWSPEALLVAAVADCFVLTFRGVARAARFEWSRLECRVEGVLERVDGVTQFSRFRTRVRLVVPGGANPATAQRLLAQAEHGCLIANSLRGTRSFEVELVTLSG